MGDIIIFDGGMGQEFVYCSGWVLSGFWFCEFMMECLDLVWVVYDDFFVVGVYVVMVNSYIFYCDCLWLVGLEDWFE